MIFTQRATKKPSLIMLLCLVTFAANAEPISAPAAQPKAKKSSHNRFLAKPQDWKAFRFIKRHKKKITASSFLGIAAVTAIAKYCVCKFGMIRSSTMNLKTVHCHKANALEQLKKRNHKFDLITDNGADGILVWPKSAKRSKKLVVWMMGNESTWQKNLRLKELPDRSLRPIEKLQLIEKTGRPMLMLNYAGVGDSKGFPSSFDRVVSKIEREIEQVEKKFGFTPKKTVLIGHSIGGYLGSKIARKRKLPFFSSRSLSTMSKTASEMTKIPQSLTKTFIWAAGWEHDAAQDFAQLEHSDHAFTTKDRIIGYNASLHEGLQKTTHPQKGHHLVPNKKLSPEKQSTLDQHNCQLVDLECKDCRKTLFDLIADFIEQN